MLVDHKPLNCYQNTFCVSSNKPSSCFELSLLPANVFSFKFLKNQKISSSCVIIQCHKMSADLVIRPLYISILLYYFLNHLNRSDKYNFCNILGNWANCHVAVFYFFRSYTDAPLTFQLRSLPRLKSCKPTHLEPHASQSQATHSRCF